MAITAVASLVDALLRHQLLEPSQAAELTLLQGRFPDARALAAELIRRDWLTPYQVNQLFLGRAADLVLGSYVLLQRLGEGGMGQVFKARHQKLGRVVALKLIRKERLDNPRAVRRFQREIRAVAGLSHPNIVRAFDADQVGTTHFLVMEFVEGTDLTKVLQRSGPLPVAQVCEYVRQAAVGLQHAHERGLVHRDVKPANLLLAARGNVVKLLDLGLARLAEVEEGGESGSTVTVEGVIMGTPDYLAPEQSRNSHTADIRSDLYSLGCTFYHLLTGETPYGKGSPAERVLRHHLDTPVPVEERRPEVLPAVAAVVRKLMARRPEDRYQTPAELAAALEAILAGGPGPEPPADAIQTAVDMPIPTPSETDFAFLGLGGPASGSGLSRPKARPGARKRWLLAGLGGALVLGLLVTLIVAALRKKEAPTDETPEERERRRAAAFESWLGEVAALPAKQQVSAVQVKLRQLNPGFDEPLAPTEEGGRVTGLALAVDHVSDLSPLRALRGLRTLDCRGSPGKKGRLTVLASLRGLKLSTLICRDTPVRDLAPLRDMPLTVLDVHSTEADDLSPLAGLPLRELDCGDCPVVDLSPLEGMRLTSLGCAGSGVTDLSPLKGMALTAIDCGRTEVVTLFPLRHLPLTRVDCSGSRVTDLSPLGGMKLTHLDCSATRVVDLSPVRGMPLQNFKYRDVPFRGLPPLADLPLREVACDFEPWRDTDVLKAIKTLQTINGQPARQFWEKADKERAAFEEWVQSVRTLTPKRQVEAVARELRARNPGFKDKLVPTIDAGQVTGLRFRPDQVADLAPVRALPGLKQLTCNSSRTAKPRLASLWPLRSLPLTDLSLNWNRQVADLTPLQGMPLEALNVRNTAVADLTDLRGLKLRRLACAGFGRITDLSPLRGMPLERLEIEYSSVSDLSPLRGMKLTSLRADHSPLRDLSPLRGMDLDYLHVQQTAVTDLGPLRGMALSTLWCDYDPWRDAALVRSLKKLQTINGQPAADFRKKMDADEAAFAEWAASVARLPAGDQAEAVEKELKRRNPRFTGRVKHKVENGVVTELSFGTNHVRDIAPVRALPGLRVLSCRGGFRTLGKVTSLWPLHGMKLTSLDCASNGGIKDLTPLKEMPLAALNCGNTAVEDLSPLKGLSLTWLATPGNRVRDLSPLRLMPLKVLHLNHTSVDDLSPLEGMKLASLSLDHSRAGHDLGWLRGLPLGSLTLGFQPWRDTGLLRSLKTLQRINNEPAVKFWTKADAERAAFASWLQAVRGLPAPQLADAVARELKDRNPGFEGKVRPTIANDVVTGLEFPADEVTDLSPVRALPGLKRLVCRGSAPGKGKLADLWPLKGLALERLDCTNTEVADLRPLQDMPLARLDCDHAQVADLSPLRGRPLKILWCDFQPERDAPILRAIPTLERINGQSAPEFWQEIDQMKK